MYNLCNFYPHSTIIKWLSDNKKYNVHTIDLKQQWYEGVFHEASFSRTV